MKSLEDFQREHGGGERYVLDPDQLSEREKLVNRCKERCLYLIEHAEKSESRLREKLRKSGKYTEDIIDEAMKMLKRYGYIDDRRFAEQLIKTYAGQKSLREIEQKLYQRGVGQAEIRAAIRRPVGARSVDGVKRRTRAGMGRCQGGFCGPRVVDLLARELGVSPLTILQDRDGSEILTAYTKGEVRA